MEYYSGAILRWGAKFATTLCGVLCHRLKTAVTPAVVFFPIPKLGISASIGNLGYERQVFKPENAASGVESSGSSLGANFGLNQLLFGGTYYFGRQA